VIFGKYAVINLASMQGICGNGRAALVHMPCFAALPKRGVTRSMAGVHQGEQPSASLVVRRSANRIWGFGDGPHNPAFRMTGAYILSRGKLIGFIRHILDDLSKSDRFSDIKIIRTT
jgi:hypothetical protein